MQFLRRTTIAGLVAGLTLAGMPVTAFAEMTMTMSLEPHCTAADRSTCPAFEVVDGSSIKTGKLSAGDILDLDVVVHGPDFSNVRSVRAWLNYEPSILEYRSVELTSELPSPSAGEQTADPAGKVVKIGGSNDRGLSGQNVAVARVTFRVLATTENVSLTFNDYKADGTGHTAVNGPRTQNETQEGRLPDPRCISVLIGCRGTPTPMLSVEPASLTVTLQDANTGIVPSAAAAQLVTATSSSASAGSASSTSSAIASTAPVASSAGTANVGGDTTFGILQVQGVKVTTKDNMVFVGWNELRSAGIKGYNVYYSTVTGRYIQRHSVPKSETSLTLRNLSADTTYYFAVRAVNEQDQESVFSQEVSVTVGRPETASSPLLAARTIGLEEKEVEGNPMEVHNGQIIRGETGTGDIVFMLVAVSAVIGTGFAFRRQLSIHHLSHV